MEITPSKEWFEVLKRFEKRGRKLFVIGASDSGKTTFLLFILNSLLERGKRVGVIDFDIGQSRIGPPTTFGFGIAENKVESLDKITPEKLYFVGSVSPKGRLLQMLVGAEKLLREVEKHGLDYILIDTTGLVDGTIAEMLKEAKIEIVDPDFIVLFEEGMERENLIKPFIHSGKKIVRIKPSPYVIRRDREERIRYREEKFRDYFKNGKLIKVIFSEKNLLGIDLTYEIPSPGTLFSFLDRDRFTLSLGIVKEFDREDSSMKVLSPLCEEREIKFIRFSKYILDF